MASAPASPATSFGDNVTAWVGTPVGLSAVVLAALLILWRLNHWRLSAARVKPEGRYVVVTGCDTGFGHILSRRLADAGYSVFAGCYSKAGAQEASKHQPERMWGVQLDVTSDASVAAFVAKVKARTDTLWALVNNAGVAGGFTADATDVDTFKNVMDINCWGGVRMGQALRPLLQKGGIGGGDGFRGGRIVNMTSIAGRVSLMTGAPYSVSKFAFEAYSDALRHEMWNWGITVSLVEPFFHATPIVSGAPTLLQRFFRSMPKARRDEFGPGYEDKL